MPPHSASHHPLKIVPKELVFPAPLNRVITNILKLHNVSSSPLAYKVKTTAPQRYCVRPNNGVLPPGETIEVQVLLNYVKDAPPNLDTRDKFQIQSIVLAGPLSNATDISEVWAKATPEQITKQKLKSRFTAAITKPGVPPALAQPTGTSSQSELGTLETTHQTPTTTTTTATQPPHDEVTVAQNHSTPQVTFNPSPTIIPHQTLSQPIPQQPIQSAVDRKESLGDSTEQQQYFTPTITSLSQKDTKQTKDIPQTQLDHKQFELPTKQETPHPEPQLIDTPPKPTGDYVADSVANHSQLRKTLEQVAALKSEREGVLKDNQRLNEQVKTLTELLQRAKEEQEKTGLRQRSTLQSTTTPGGPTLSHTLSHSQPLSSQAPHIQIQTKVLLFLILFFVVFGFLLGRYTR